MFIQITGYKTSLVITTFIPYILGGKNKKYYILYLQAQLHSSCIYLSISIYVHTKFCIQKVNVSHSIEHTYAYASSLGRTAIILILSWVERCSDIASCGYFY